VNILPCKFKNKANIVMCHVISACIIRKTDKIKPIEQKDSFVIVLLVLKLKNTSSSLKRELDRGFLVGRDVFLT